MLTSAPFIAFLSPEFHFRDFVRLQDRNHFQENGSVKQTTIENSVRLRDIMSESDSHVVKSQLTRGSVFPVACDIFQLWGL